jgi:3-oxoacyl-[acyl-carrier protein] reductase
MKLLQNKRILITGGSMGLGFATAKACVEQGGKVILVARGKQSLKEAARKLNRAGESAVWRAADVGRESEVARLARWVRGKYGKIDGLVNCAAVIGTIGTLDQVKMKDFSEALRINILGTVYPCHFFAPLLKRGRGKIVNYAGGGGTAPFANYSSYGIAKAAVVRLTENLAEEYKPLGISVNACSPGFVMTRIHDQTFKAGKKAGWFLQYTRDNFKKGGVPPEKGAELTVFLLSSRSDGINGKVISAPWDPWQKPGFQRKARTQKNFAALRRIDDMYYREIRRG